jgi:hypothetical protein
MTYDADTLREMMPFYLTGQLTGQEKDAFLQGLAAHPELTAELAEYKAIQESYRDLEAETPFPTPDSQFNRIMERIDREAAASAAQEKTARFGRPAGLRQKWAAITARKFFSPGIAWSVAAVQAVLLVALLAPLPGRETFETMTMPGSGGDGVSMLNVVFDENAPEKAIRALLVKSGVMIVGGPSANGRYIVAIPGEHDRETVSGDFIRSGIVTLVEPRY